MGHMRMSNEAVKLRGGWLRPRRVSASGGEQQEYYFSLSGWQSIAYLGQGELVLEDGYVDPNIVFPPGVMRKVDYGIRFGLEARVVEYRSVAGAKIGAILFLTVGNGKREIGCYVVRYGAGSGNEK